jgi:SHS2 domain-containing protein
MNIEKARMKEGYRILEHPSDMGIEAHGSSMKEVFEYAALGLVSIIVDPATIDPVEQRYVKLKGSDPENLLVKWLSEVLYLYDGQDFLISDVRIDRLTSRELDAVVTGETADERKHSFRSDVKAITYHQLKVEEREDGCVVTVFVDI